jgi:small conductance mechanosensitive channel
MNFFNNNPHFDKAIELCIAYTPKLVLAIILLVFGGKIINSIVVLFKKSLEKKEVDSSLIGFLTSIFKIIGQVSLYISIAGILGIETTSFIAILGAAGLAVGMALQGTLGNFAGGTLIILLKPFKVGDYIEAQGFSGTVKNIQIFCTVLNTPDNKTIILPNGPLSTSSIINYSTEKTRRVDMTFGIGYNDDLKLAKNTLLSIGNADSRILKEPGLFVAVSELADSSVNFTFRAHVDAADYWGVYFDTIEKVKLTFDELNISIPYPQQDLHLHQLK